MEGEHCDMLQVLRDNTFPTALVSALNFLLEHQYISFCNRTFKVIVGSGMGSQFSSDLRDVFSPCWLKNNSFPRRLTMESSCMPDIVTISF